MKKKLLAGLVVLGILLAAAGGYALLPRVEESSKYETLVIQTRDGRQHEFRVEIADEPHELEKGLMFREHLDADAGMLFIFPQPLFTSFWMKNTLIPLDMVFIRQSGRIARVHANAQPQSLTSIPSLSPVLAVLELNGGTAERLGIGPGDRVVHKAFK